MGSDGGAGEARAPFPLTTGQRRRLEITLVRVAEEARDMADLVRREAGDTAMSREMVAHLGRIRADAAKLADDLGLSRDQKTVSWRRKVQAWASLSWSDVLDSGPGPLRGYGAVDPVTAGFLGPRIEVLAEELLAVSARARGTPDDG